MIFLGIERAEARCDETPPQPDRDRHKLVGVMVDAPFLSFLFQSPCESQSSGAVTTFQMSASTPADWSQTRNLIAESRKFWAMSRAHPPG